MSAGGDGAGREVRAVMATEARAYVAAGSNLGEPRARLLFAMRELRARAGVLRLRSSPWYRSAAIGPGEQPDYLNAVFELHTTLAPLELLEVLQHTEAQAGRVRTERWGPRTLDLDILLYDGLCLQDARLTLPHPRLAERNFVVFPLHDLDPALVLPGGAVLAELRTALDSRGLWRFEERCHELA
jgi:2-amino-4-hydroxy-6-hydroxymethyldihydropteridine diphosphokinase